MTKEIEMADGLRKLLQSGQCKIQKEEINKVIYENEEIKMFNIRNRKNREEKIYKEVVIEEN